MTVQVHPIIAATYDLLGAIQDHRERELARWKAYEAGERRTLRQIADYAAASLIEIRELKKRGFMEWSKAALPSSLSFEEINRRMDALVSLCPSYLTWERHGHKKGGSILAQVGMQLQEAGDRIDEFLQAWREAEDQRRTEAQRESIRGAGSTKKRGGRPRLELSKPMVFQVYQRIQDQHRPGEDYAETLDRLKSNKDFVEQVREAGLKKLSPALVRNALALFEQRKRDDARKKQETGED
jgi:hypothetical protein